MPDGFGRAGSLRVARFADANSLMSVPWPPDSETVRAELLDLFREHGPSLYRLTRFILQHHQDAEDIVQEAFLKLLKHLESGGGRANLRGWLFATAANGCRDRLRARRRWMPWTPEHDQAVAPVETDSSHQRAAARAAARRLSARDRLLLTLRAQGLAYREIAAAAGVHEGSVGRLLARAIDRWQREVTRNRQG